MQDLCNGPHMNRITLSQEEKKNIAIRGLQVLHDTANYARIFKVEMLEDFPCIWLDEDIYLSIGYKELENDMENHPNNHPDEFKQGRGIAVSIRHRQDMDAIARIGASVPTDVRALERMYDQKMAPFVEIDHEQAVKLEHSYNELVKETQLRKSRKNSDAVREDLIARIQHARAQNHGDLEENLEQEHSTGRVRSF